MKYGLIIPQGLRNISKCLPLFLEEDTNELSNIGRKFLSDLYEYLNEKKRIKKYDAFIQTIFDSDERYKKNS